MMRFAFGLLPVPRGRGLSFSPGIFSRPSSGRKKKDGPLDFLPGPVYSKCYCFGVLVHRDPNAGRAEIIPADLIRIMPA